MMRLRYSEAARKDLKSIYKRSAQQFGVVQAERYRTGLLEALQSVAEMPLAAPSYDGYRQPVRIRVYGSHMIIYAVEGENIIVSRVLHQLQDWQNLL